MLLFFFGKMLQRIGGYLILSSCLTWIGCLSPFGDPLCFLYFMTQEYINHKIYEDLLIDGGEEDEAPWVLYPDTLPRTKVKDPEIDLFESEISYPVAEQDPLPAPVDIKWIFILFISVSGGVISALMIQAIKSVI